jgi:NAD(P)-dependent dehydrogenase (short-subunit alcohol dehydrogenase family)
MVHSFAASQLLVYPDPSAAERAGWDKVPARPDDIAAACSFLVSEGAGYVTGQVIGVNGGRNT